ncbi:hypothetical protein TpMuguga_02g00894 [Theileria parva strain Muguga]|uniref:CD8+ T cell target antigen Tp9 n=1 Tax=Theileria parva TaxID=5875 RepID=Q4N3U4_THEPA|nr:uncharacterized protein TpMuguga_02g00894 [Theileria parva strain Muguga]EAN33179.1 hypothetical protein TpMuguga_02g00894 [Theileria parva strain Muguga]|eukprot:XP_765462.1 hypothetical protein [Theileria parva strain Muguga]
MNFITSGIILYSFYTSNCMDPGDSSNPGGARPKKPAKQTPKPPKRHPGGQPPGHGPSAEFNKELQDKLKLRGKAGGSDDTVPEKPKPPTSPEYSRPSKRTTRPPPQDPPVPDNQPGGSSQVYEVSDPQQSRQDYVNVPSGGGTGQGQQSWYVNVETGGPEGHIAGASGGATSDPIYEEPPNEDDEYAAGASGSDDGSASYIEPESSPQAHVEEGLYANIKPEETGAHGPPRSSEGSGGSRSGSGKSSGPRTRAADGTQLVGIDAKSGKNNPFTTFSTFRSGPKNLFHRQYNPSPGCAISVITYNGKPVWQMGEDDNYAMEALIFPIGSSEKTIIITLKSGTTETFEKKGRKKPWKKVD